MSHPTTPPLSWLGSLLILSAQGMASEAIAPSDLKPGAYSHLQYLASTGETMHYYVYVPTGYSAEAKLPLLIEVHGAGPQPAKDGGGGSARRYLGLNPNYAEAKYPCIFVEPMLNADWKVSCWDSKGWKTGSHTMDLKAPPKGIAILLEFLPKIIADLKSDPDRTYVTGASNGGYATWDLITYRPDLFAAAIPICGAGDPSQAARIKDLPIWTFHGTADPTVPFTGTTEMVAALEAAGGKPRHLYFEGMGHKSWDPAWKTPDLVPWLFAQNRSERAKATPAAPTN